MIDDWGLSGTPQYGAGDSFQATCPAFLPAPPGYTSWSAGTNGPIPADVQAAAVALSKDMTKPLGYTQTMYSGGVPLILRVDAHTWTTDASGAVVAGCYHAVDVWIPIMGAAPIAAPSSSSTSNTLLAVSILLGGVVSALSIVEYFRGRKV
jgi:hypothetical protein